MSGSALRAVMEDSEYDRERAQLRVDYGDPDGKAIAVVAKRDQAYASLFHRSGWTQERIAAKERKSPAWVTYRLRFGRFLANSTEFTLVNSAQNLTEGRFRAYWERSDRNEKNENIRFRAVIRLMEQDMRLQKVASSGLGRQVMEHFADGEWHKFETILGKLDCEDADLQSVLKNMREHGANKSVVETKPYGAGQMYRIMRRDRTISLHELTTKLTPLVNALVEEGRKSTARMSPPTVASLAFKIQQLLQQWSE